MHPLAYEYPLPRYGAETLSYQRISITLRSAALGQSKSLQVLPLLLQVTLQISAWFLVVAANSDSKENGGFSCDDESPQYKSSKLCSHVVAVAERARRLSGLVLALHKEKNKGHNLSKLALTTMPKGRGRKGGKLPPRKRAGIEIEQ